jgi:hypothetical protein
MTETEPVTKADLIAIRVRQVSARGAARPRSKISLAAAITADVFQKENYLPLLLDFAERKT